MERKPPSCKRKMLNTYYQNVVSLPLSDVKQLGNGVEKPTRNNLTDWNGQEGFLLPNFRKIIPRKDVSENPSKTL
ncbi:MAG: hypothetical protein J5I52_06745 [Saprospiraceae bacterium]|nr:hypothetical protein [Saprospiraceae bacterium]